MIKLLFFAAMLMILESYAQNADTLLVTSTVTKVTVFSKGAQVTRKGKVKLQKGKILLLMGGLPTTLSAGSVQVQGVPFCTTLSVKHQLTEPKYVSKEPKEKVLRDKIKVLDLNIKELNNKINVFEQEEKLLQANSKLGSETKGATIAEIREAADFYRLRLNEIKASKLKLETELGANIATRQELYNAITNLGREDQKQSYSEMLVLVDCKRTADTVVEFSYYVPNAGWSPLYDFRVDDVSKPLLIDYNANVFQSSGEEWKNVKLKLSTANPSLSGKLPVMDAWYLGASAIPVRSTDVAGGDGALKGTVRDNNTKEPIPFCIIILEQDGWQKMSTTSDMDGNYNLRPVNPGKYDLKASNIGFKPILIRGIVIRSESMEFQDIAMEATSLELQSVEVVDYKVPLISRDNKTSGATVSSEEILKMPSYTEGSSSRKVAGINSGNNNNRGSGSTYNTYEIPVKQEVITNYFSSSLRTTVTNLEYEIELPYTIPADGEDYNVKIKQSSVPVDYEYHAIPKIDNDVFLTALVPDWSSLNLMPGKVNIYYQGTFSGESKIDADITSDTLVLSLGRDNNITVSREGNKEKNDKRFIGSTVKEDIGWIITVRNNKSSDIKIIIDDQYPLSVRKSIEVEPPKIMDAKITELTGAISWELQLTPGEKKVLTYNYTVKYPRYENITVN